MRPVRTLLLWFALASLGLGFEAGTAEEDPNIMFMTGLLAHKAGKSAEAVTWYRKAADRGLTNAMNMLAAAYQAGDGIEKDAFEAERWYRQSADAGNSAAMYRIAVMYEGGRGVAKNPKDSAFYIFQALKRNNATAREEMTKNANAWSVETRRELQTLLQVDGVYEGPIDGKFGAGVKRAIQALIKKGV